VKEGHVPSSKKAGMAAMTLVLSKPTLYRIAGKMGRVALKYAPFVVNNSLNPWYKQRDMPQAPEESFREWYQKNRK
jgi:L-lactate dehydrogenase complex protein LldF